jgi:hypothetical protein
MIASRVRRVLTHALNQIAPVSGYPGRMLALLRKTPAHNGFPFTQERRDLMERARAQLTLLGFAPCMIDVCQAFVTNCLPGTLTFARRSTPAEQPCGSAGW